MLPKSTIEKVVEVFFDEPTQEHYLKEISRKAGVAHTSVKKHLETLAQANIITKSMAKKGKRTFPSYKANTSHKTYRWHNSINNVQRLEESGVLDHIYDTLAPKCLVVFGSYRFGEDTEESDVDIFVESKKQDINLKAYEKKIKRKIQLHFKIPFTSYPKELKNNVINGIVLRGFLEGYS